MRVLGWAGTGGCYGVAMQIRKYDNTGTVRAKGTADEKGWMADAEASISFPHVAIQPKRRQNWRTERF